MADSRPIDGYFKGFLCLVIGWHNSQFGDGIYHCVDDRVCHSQHRLVILAVWVAKLGVYRLLPPAKQ